MKNLRDPISGTRMRVSDPHSCIAIVTFRSSLELIFYAKNRDSAYNESGNRGVAAHQPD
jgi:hypothetical protein